MKLTKNKIIVIVSILLITLIGSGAAAAHYLPNRLLQEVTFEIGSADTVDVNSFFIYEDDQGEFETDINSIDLTKLGTHDVRIKVYNYLTYSSVLKVVDTTKPEVVTRDLNVGFNTKLEPEDFIVSATDNTEITHKFKNEIDPKKETQEVTIITTDIAGNMAETTSKLSFYNVVTSITKELGETSELVPEDFLVSTNSDVKIEFKTQKEIIDKYAVGEHTIILILDGKEVTAKVIVEDTTPPTGTVKNPTFYKDYVVNINDFIEESFDLSGVTLSYKDNTAPNVSKSGEFTQIIVLTDGHGNKTELTATYTVLIDEEKPVISGARDLEIIIGEPFNLRGGTYVTDNVDKDIKLIVDDSKVKTNVEGEYKLIYKATDKAGNSTSQEVTVKVRKRLPYQPMGDTGNPTLNEMVDNILSNIIHGEMNNYEKVQRIYNFGVTIRYAAGDVTNGYATDAINTLRTRIGNCFGRMHAMEALFDRAGIPNREQIQYKREHSWNQVNIGNGWQNIDIGFNMFLASDATLKANEYRHMSFIPYLWSLTDPKDDNPVVSVVNINYLEDGSRKVLHPQDVLKGHLGQQYTSRAVVIPGYKLRFNPHNANGIYNRDVTNVNYIYVIDETQKPVDKTALKAAIDKATAMSADNQYKPSYQNQLKSAVESATKIHDAYTSNQQMVDGQTSNLNALINSPQKRADVSGLQTKINEANTFIQNRISYDKNSIAALEAEVAKATPALTNVEISATELDQHVKNIQAAIGRLIPIDKTGLKASIDSAKAIDKTQYQLSAVTPFETALKNSEVVYNNSSVQADINSANTSLDTAIKTLTSSQKIDKSMLQASLNQAAAVDRGLYTQASLATLDSAVANGNSVMGSIVNQDAVKTAADQINAAVKGLKIQPADKTALVNAINDAKAIVREQYTPESLVAFEQALSNANTINAKIKATQDEIDSATSALTNAINNLQKPIPPTPTTPEPTPTEPVTP